ncbi:hypothetical protein D7X88_15145 [bacterium C-53]|nr:hypothetical protein [Lachnospiraceae bacterium]NBI02205.1 hypothetical protein [Lachnospiraceae bacterium]RKJ08398.1 hypothetical protein D7X88_15145 [bacterium C-53]
MNSQIQTTDPSDIFLYEIIEDYKYAESAEEQSFIFKQFCHSLWQNNNKRRLYTKAIRFQVKKDLLSTETGRIFNAWSEIEYKSVKSRCASTDSLSLLHQKINNLYTKYFDREVILHPDYMELLRTPKRLYFDWVRGQEMTPDEAETFIHNAMSKAHLLKEQYQKQKIELSFTDYTQLIEHFLSKAFQNAKLIDERECSLTGNLDFVCEDNLYIRYFCKYLDHEMKQWQRSFYGVKGHKPLGRCCECGALYEKKAKDYAGRCCPYCKKIKAREQTRLRVQKYREKQKCNAG